MSGAPDKVSIVFLVHDTHHFSRKSEELTSQERNPKNPFEFNLRAKSKNFLFCCTLPKEKLKWFYLVALVVSSLRMSVVALGLCLSGKADNSDQD